MKAFQKLTFIVCLPAAMLLLSAQASHGGSATWNLNPGTSDWNTATNWTPATVPNGSGDTATFALSNTTGVSLSFFTEVNGIVFNSGASAFTITASPMFTLTISGVGITNNSGLTQNFVTAVNGAGNLGTLFFTNSATAGSLTAFTNNGSTFNGASGGEVIFSGTSTAGGGTFTNNGGAVSGAFGGEVLFEVTSTAGNGTFTNNGGAVSGGQPGITEFLDSSTAGNGTLINNGGGGSGPFGGTVFFSDTSTAGNGTFTNNGGAVSGASGSIIDFQGTSTAGNGTFTNNGGTVGGASGGNIVFFSAAAGSGTFINNGGAVSNAGGSDMQFSGTSTAGNGILIANGGLGGGGGGLIRFFDDSTGGTARVEVFGNGSLDLTGHNAPGVTVGSIEGSGAVTIAANNLTVGSNNLSTNFSGLISGGGSLAKIGAGTLTLSGPNFYSGGTSINAGTLEASQDGALGFADVSVTAPGATLRLQTGATNNYVADAATLSIVSGSTVDLNFSGTADMISGLLVDGVAQPTGLYGSVGSGAPHELKVFAGTGRIQVGVLLPPVITSPSTATAAVNQAFSYQITATNNPTSFDATGLPPNLTVDTSTGLISGTPAAAGIFSITLSATNADGTGTAPLTLTVNPPPPVITSPSTATAAVNQAFSYQITATNNPTSFDATGLPAGLTVNTATGLISGTPTAAGTFSVNLSATNAGGTGTASLTLTVNQAPAITSADKTTFAAGSNGSFTVTATGIPTPTLSESGALPSGVTFNTATGVLSGTPAAGTDGIYPITFTASNGVPPDATQSFTLTISTVTQAPAITSANNTTFAVGSNGSFTVMTTGIPTPTLSESGALPSGVTFNTATGVLSGTPAAGTDGIYPITFTASNGVPPDAMQSFTLTISLSPVITSPLSATATVGQFYVYQIVATGSPSSYDALNLPPGLSPPDPALGFISGTPTDAGTTEVTISATNTNGTTTETLIITVQDAPVSGPNIIGGPSVTGRTGSPFYFQVLTSGSSPAARLSASGLPPDLTVDPQTGEITGTPTIDGSFPVTLTIDDGGLSTSSTLQLTFTSDLAVPVIVSPSSATLVPGQFFTYQIDAPSSSDEPILFGQLGPLPPGLGLDPVTGIISGTPRLNLGLVPTPLVAAGVITNTEIFACNPSSGCAAKDIDFLVDRGGAVNISTRLSVGTADDALIAGFIIAGNSDMKVILRGIGPSLSVMGPLADPFLELRNFASVSIGTNDNWKVDNDKGGSQEAAIPLELRPSQEKESAILAVLKSGTASDSPPFSEGSYTAIVSGKNNTTGVGLAEVYNLGVASFDVASDAYLANISTRGKVQTGDNVMIGGFINKGNDPIKVVVRAIGPTLPFGAGNLANPFLELHKPDGTIVTNDDWKAPASQIADITATGLQPSDDHESVIITTLPPGGTLGLPYTAIVKGVGDTSGIGLVEVYFGDPCLGTVCP